jgi:hypothetical protein
MKNDGRRKKKNGKNSKREKEKKVQVKRQVSPTPSLELFFFFFFSAQYVIMLHILYAYLKGPRGGQREREPSHERRRGRAGVWLGRREKGHHHHTCLK